MICLTADVHHSSLGGLDQKFLDVTEAQAVLEYSKIAEDWGVNTTIFITGKTVEEDEDSLKKIMEKPNVEVGGHTYYAFKPNWLYNGVFDRLLGRPCGPSFYQDYEIKKTINIFKDRLCVEINSWRNHSYRKDENTYDLLSKNGIKIVFDERNPELTQPKKIGVETGDIISVPINVIPDHSHLYHGGRTVEYVRKKVKRGWRDPFGSESYSIKEFYQIIKKQIRNIENKNGIAVLLLHPACMKIADDFETFEKICEFLGDYETVNAKDLAG